MSRILGQRVVFDKPKKRNPRLMIYDVEPHDDKEKLIDDIYDQNMGDTDIDMEAFKKEFLVVHEYKRKDPKDTRVAMVVECSARVRHIIRRNDRVYTGWQSCRIRLQPAGQMFQMSEIWPRGEVL